ncbi:hypothetical protein NP233_g11054 [Leucocoprinus birnbaumii]|uniref:Mitochondrial intermembrane space import and assembly protein 40 n=1 Tax=Leucocoprinus birnbaumii TaxID=56174 RepID=A0AAD5VN59_9AGAR|nr:hypothetical protein NP233_g11054 [Leucocoprinus birnbaumii]
MPNGPAAHYRSNHYRASSPTCYENKTQQRSPFPREGTPAPTIRGKPGLSSYCAQHQQAGMTESRPYQPSDTSSWVLEQEYLRKERTRQNKKTQQWVFEQRTLFPGETLRSKEDLPAAWEERTRDQMWDELVYSYELEADRSRRQQEEVRRMAAERERTKARYVQEELKRLEGRLRAKREAERQRLVEEKLRLQMEARERDRKERANVQKAISDAWDRYESGWETLISSTAALGFEDIPWPTKSIPTAPSDITPSAVVYLLLSPFHSPKQTRKERLRSAQLRWHPDRFRRVINRVNEEDREAVEEGVGIIARCLNDLMSKEKTPTAHPQLSRFARTAVGVSAVTATYLTWRLLSEPIALDSNTPTSSLQKPTIASKAPSKATVTSPSGSNPETSSVPDSEPSPELSPSSQPAKLNDEVEGQGSGDASGQPAEGEEGSQPASGGAFNPETGEINWDCPCLGGMAHGPCGPEFKEAFSCFVFSEEEPKGIDCVEKFKAMQDCFRRHPEVYSDEIMDDDEEEATSAPGADGSESPPSTPAQRDGNILSSPEAPSIPNDASKPPAASS